MRTLHGRTSLLLALVAALAGSSCTHALRVRNIGDYANRGAPAERLALALEDRSGSPEASRYFEHVHRALAVRANVAPATQTGKPGDPFLPSRLVRVRTAASYGGSPWNYFITFPGFLLFTHAWNGFVYSARIETDVEILDEVGRMLAHENIPVEYDLRYTSFARGAWTSSGWYTPGWGALNVLLGFLMVPYDSRATEELQQEIGPAYGDYVAARILEMASTSPPRGEVFLPMPAAAVPPATAPARSVSSAIAPARPTPKAVPILDPVAGVEGPSVASRGSVPSPALESPAVPESVRVARLMIEKLQELQRLHVAGELSDGDYEAIRERVIAESMRVE